MIQCTMSTWASPVIIVPKKGLETPKDPKTLLPVDARLRLVCDYQKLNQKLPADFLSYDKEGQRIEKQGISTPYPLPCIDKMLASIRGRKFLTTLDCTGAFHCLKLSPDAGMKSAFIAHLGKFQWNIAPFGLALLPSCYSKAMQDTLSGLEEFARNYMDDVLIGHRKQTFRPRHTSFRTFSQIQNETQTCQVQIWKKQDTICRTHNQP